MIINLLMRQLLNHRPVISKNIMCVFCERAGWILHIRIIQTLCFIWRYYWRNIWLPSWRISCISNVLLLLLILMRLWIENLLGHSNLSCTLLLLFPFKFDSMNLYTLFLPWFLLLHWRSHIINVLFIVLIYCLPRIFKINTHVSLVNRVIH